MNIYGWADEYAKHPSEILCLHYTRKPNTTEYYLTFDTRRRTVLTLPTPDVTSLLSFNYIGEDREYFGRDGRKLTLTPTSAPMTEIIALLYIAKAPICATPNYLYIPGTTDRVSFMEDEVADPLIYLPYHAVLPDSSIVYYNRHNQYKRVAAKSQ